MTDPRSQSPSFVTDDAPGERLRLLEVLGAELRFREERAVAGPPPRETVPGLTLPEAYVIQAAYVATRTQAGERVVGHKVGCTNPLVQQQFGVDQPDFGHLLDRMIVHDGALLDVTALIQPMIEPEIAFRLTADLAGPGITPDDVMDATDWVAPCFEVIDSRVRNWDIHFVDTVADNGSSSAVVLGEEVDLHRLPGLRSLGVVLERNGEVVGTGAGAAVLGHPAAAIAWLANALGGLGDSLRAGHVVLPGALTPAARARAGDGFSADFGALGTVGCRMGGVR